MSATPAAHEASAGDPLDMGQYRIDRLPKRQRTRIEINLARAGIPLGTMLFVLFGFLWTPEWLINFDIETLPARAAAVLAEVGADEFTRRGAFMLGIFCSHWCCGPPSRFPVT
jgi:solute carrier family 13 (sodium-dependent dicarboxylate transporter), member 2/3/5